MRATRIVALVGGTGHLGVGLAARLAQAGIDVVIGSRTPEKAQQAAARLARDGVRGANNADAGRRADLIILTVPSAAHHATVQSLSEVIDGKVVVDTTVPLAQGAPLRLERPAAGSAAEEAQMLLRNSRVISAFHTVSASMLADLSRPLHGDVLLCGEDSAAKASVEELIRAIKMRPVDAGGLALAHTLEQLALLVLILNRRYRRGDLGIAVAGLGG